MTDEAGGAHCCWIYNVISLWPKPHKLFDVGADAAVNFAKDKDGKTIIWERVGGTTEYTGGVDAPFAERVYRVQGSKLVDATPDFCGKILSPGGEDYAIDWRADAVEHCKPKVDEEGRYRRSPKG